MDQRGAGGLCSRPAFHYNGPAMTLENMRDRDRIFGAIVTHRLRAMGIRDKTIAPASPWQNAFAERLIGSIRRECVDHMIVLGEAHLRRTHRSLNKDAPISRAVQRIGIVKSHANPDGLHHHYVRI